MAYDPEKWNPGFRDVPPEIEAELRKHWESCPSCEHVAEWQGKTPSTGTLSFRSDPDRMDVRKWSLAHTSLPPGLVIVVRDAAGGFLYGCWYPRREAVRLRDTLQAWFPDK